MAQNLTTIRHRISSFFFKLTIYLASTKRDKEIYLYQHVDLLQHLPAAVVPTG